MKTELFQPGQFVVWGELTDTMKYVIEGCGPGPFRILSVQTVPNKCNCGEALDNEAHKSGMCPYKYLGNGYGRSIRESVGHPQWVTVADVKGDVLMGTYPKREAQRFSGRYFTVA